MKGRARTARSQANAAAHGLPCHSSLFTLTYKQENAANRERHSRLFRSCPVHPQLLHAHPHLFLLWWFASVPKKPASTGPEGAETRRSGKCADRASSFTSAAALEAQGAGEGAHGRVERVPHRRGLAGGGVRLAAVAVGLAGLLVHPQRRQRELLPTGERGSVGRCRALRGRGVAAARRRSGGNTGNIPYLFSRRPLPVSRKPLAKGLLSIFSWVICSEGDGERRWREAGPVSTPPPPSGSPGCSAQAAKRAAARL